MEEDVTTVDVTIVLMILMTTLMIGILQEESHHHKVVDDDHPNHLFQVNPVGENLHPVEDNPHRDVDLVVEVVATIRTVIATGN